MMKTKTQVIFFGILVIGILFINIGLVSALDFDGDDEIPPEEEQPPEDEPKDDDQDGIDDTVEDNTKRDVIIWIGENVVEVSSIKRSEERKDVIDLRVGYSDYGLSVRVSYGTFIPCESEEHPKDENPEASCEETIEYKIRFEVMFRSLIEFVDIDGDGVLKEEVDEIISDYGFTSFQPIEYSLINISNETNMHYLLFNTTDGIFAAHVYLVEEFVLMNDVVISPTQAKIDIEIANYDYSATNSQLALMTKLWSEETYHESEETHDEKEGYAEGEKDVYVKNSEYSGFFSWKETAMIDGVEMDVKTRELTYEEGDLTKLLICYPRGNHIYHDPKIGIAIYISQNGGSLFPFVLTSSLISLIGLTLISGLILKKRRIL